MERPSKRPRLSFNAEPEDNSDNIDLQAARAQNDQRLKSIFEGIFEKYGKDFTDVGDEIDLQTGRIVVDNGHIQAMENEDDTGEQEVWVSDTDSNVGNDAHNIPQHSQTSIGSDLLEDNNTYPQYLLTAAQATQFQARPGLDWSWDNKESEALNPEPDTDDDRSSVDSLLDSALNVQNGPGESGGKTGPTDPKAPITEKAKSAAATSVQSQGVHAGGFTEAVDSLWRVPEISSKFYTPPSSKTQPAVSFNTVRSPSPPGAGSIWALPWKSRRGTDVAKRNSERKHSSSPRKRKQQSSPIVIDWSFAQTPDGDESDDPLQESYQPSPTPKSTLNLRGKRLESVTPSRTNIQRDDGKLPLSYKDQGSQHHVPVDGQRGTTETTKQLDAINDNVASNVQLETNGNTGASDNSSVVTQKLKAREIGNQAVSEDSSTPSKRAKTTTTPGEARTIVVMRHVQGKMWKEIADRLPGKSISQVTQWNHLHWTERQSNPPALSKPWSKAERKSLDNLKDQHDLTWHEIRTILPGRSGAELEFELLRLWVGDNTRNSEQHNKAIASFGLGERLSDSPSTR